MTKVVVFTKQEIPLVTWIINDTIYAARQMKY